MRVALRGGQGAEFLEHFALDGQDLFFGFEDFGFQLLQFGRGVTLGVDQGLLAFVIGGRVVRLALEISM